MKKFLLMLVVAAAFTACNNDGSTEGTDGDTITPIDSPAMTVPVDTLTTPADTTVGDTTRM